VWGLGHGAGAPPPNPQSPIPNPQSPYILDIIITSKIKYNLIIIKNKTKYN
jgi:hypothetical protein